VSHWCFSGRSAVQLRCRDQTPSPGVWAGDPRRRDGEASVGGVELVPLPRCAAWRHMSARHGFEVMFNDRLRDGARMRGVTTAVEDEKAWSVGYTIRTSSTWRTLRLEATLRGRAGDRRVVLEQVDDGRWVVDRRPAPQLDGCADVDLESSASTNTLPVHRLALTEGVSHQVPAAFVRADDLSVHRLEQTYELITTTSEGLIVAYSAPSLRLRLHPAVRRRGAGSGLSRPCCSSLLRPAVPAGAADQVASRVDRPEWWRGSDEDAAGRGHAAE
jgi:uncharacterized protein